MTQMVGSFQNRLMEKMTGTPEPEVGTGATEYRYSDREAFTIVEVTRFKSGYRKGQVSGFKMQADKATRTDANGMSDCQNYTFESDPDGGTYEVKVAADGSFRRHGNLVVVGIRQKYYDYSF